MARKIFFVALLLCAALTKTDVSSWNDSSRMATIESLVTHHTFAIEGSRLGVTGDKFEYRGHFYSDKPPLLALYGAALALGVQSALHVPFERNERSMYYLLTVLTDGLAYAFGLAFLYATLLKFGVRPRWSLAVVAIAGLATLALPYATVFNNHLAAGGLLMAGFYALIGRRDTLGALTGGVLLALAAAVDIAFAVFLALGPLLIGRAVPRLLAFGAAALPVMIGYAALNALESGSIAPPAMNVALWQYGGSFFNAANLSGVATHHDVSTQLVYGFNMIVGSRGLFSFTPVLLFSAWAAARLLRERTFRYRREFWFVVLSCTAYVALYALKSTNYSGDSYGVRWFAGLMFLGCVPLGFVPQLVSGSAWLRQGFLAAVLASTALATLGLVNAFPATPPILNNARTLLASVNAQPTLGIEAVALYAAFCALLVRLLIEGGEPPVRIANEQHERDVSIHAAPIFER